MSKSNKGKGKGLAVVLVVVLVGAAGFVGWLWGNDWMFSDKPKQITPDLDGVINKREWARASYMVPFYLDVDNEIDPLVDKANVDGWNYMYVAEDENYYYVALDLCSDRTNNKDGEWISFQLANRIPDTSGSRLAVLSLEDLGYEYFYYNVTDDTIFEHGIDLGPGSTPYYDIPIVPETDIISVWRGDADGDHYDFWTFEDYKNYTVSSRYYDPDGIWTSGDFLTVHFAVNITEKLPDGEISAILASMTDMDLHYTLQSNLTSNPPTAHEDYAEQFYCAIAEHGGMPGNMSSGGFLVDPNYMYFDADTITTSSVDLQHTNINATDGMFYFSLHGWNEVNGTDPTAYNIEIDSLDLKLYTDTIDSVYGNSIAPGNYEIAYSYGPSGNCAEDHRIFEFRIAKSEFPVTPDDMLYVSVSGYGTMSIENTNYWLYPIYGWPMPHLYYSPDGKMDFLSLDMSFA